MPLPTVPASAFFAPLDVWLGAPARVRVLRALSNHGGPLAVAQLVRETRLTRAAVHMALRTLLPGHLVVAVGQGRTVLVMLNATHPLAGAISDVFRHERERVATVITGLGRLAASVDPTPVSVWIYGSVALRQDTHRSDLDIAVITRDTSARWRDFLVKGIQRLGQKAAIRPSVIFLPAVDGRVRLPRGGPQLRAFRDALPVWGLSPDVVLGDRRRTTG